jgi:hypothetical protein
MEWRETGEVLAKQVLSQLSYTPIEIGSLENSKPICYGVLPPGATESNCSE